MARRVVRRRAHRRGAIIKDNGRRWRHQCRTVSAARRAAQWRSALRARGGTRRTTWAWVARRYRKSHRCALWRINLGRASSVDGLRRADGARRSSIGDEAIWAGDGGRNWASQPTLRTHRGEGRRALRAALARRRACAIAPLNRHCALRKIRRAAKSLGTCACGESCAAGACALCAPTLSVRNKRAGGENICAHACVAKRHPPSA